MYERELETALAAARLAGQRLVEEYARFVAIPNAPADITTEADRQSQEIILQYLHQAFPEDALCAEETTATLATMPHVGPRLWIVDPIDGTRGFAQKNGEFSVMIGFVHEGRIGLWQALRGYDPGRGTRFSTYAVPAITHALWRAVAAARATPADWRPLIPPPVVVRKRCSTNKWWINATSWWAFSMRGLVRPRVSRIQERRRKFGAASSTARR